MNVKKMLTTTMLSAALAAAAAPAFPVNAATTPAVTSKSEKKNFLKEMVDAGTLSQSTYDAIMAYKQAQAAEKKAAKEAAKTTKEEKKAAREAKKAADGTEKTKVKKEKKSDTTASAANKKTASKKSGKNIYAAMLEANEITQAEYDAIMAAMPAKTAKK